jgi:hypothetical protein
MTSLPPPAAHVRVEGLIVPLPVNTIIAALKGPCEVIQVALRYGHTNIGVGQLGENGVIVEIGSRRSGDPEVHVVSLAELNPCAAVSGSVPSRE